MSETESHQNQAGLLGESSADGKVKPLMKNGCFNNPWSTWKERGFKDVIHWKLTNRNHTNLPDSKELDRQLPVHFITPEEIEKFCKADTTNSIQVIWIGHATSLINFQNNIILMDPVFSERCSPSQWVGPKRYRPVPIKINDLPRVDAVVISHNHYDHLDYQSVIDLNRKFADHGIGWFVGLGTAEWFHSCGITKNVFELNWWESKKFKDLEFVFTPSQHWCTRTSFDRNKALWGSWTVIGKNRRFFFAGDTGYCPVFKDIGKFYGPFNYSFIPIGAYEPRWFMEPQHVDPEQAVMIHMDVKSQKSLAVHWGTFALADEFYLEPKQKLSEALSKFALDPKNFITLKHGEINQFE